MLKRGAQRWREERVDGDGALLDDDTDEKQLAITAASRNHMIL